MTTRDGEIFEAISALVAKFNPAGKPLTPETGLTTDLNIDSVAAMDLVMEIEDRFDIDIPVNQISEVRSIGDLVGIVQARLDG